VTKEEMLQAQYIYNSSHGVHRMKKHLFVMSELMPTSERASKKERKKERKKIAAT
jgi:hypothetical protein